MLSRFVQRPLRGSSSPLVCKAPLRANPARYYAHPKKKKIDARLAETVTPSLLSPTETLKQLEKKRKAKESQMKDPERPPGAILIRLGLEYMDNDKVDISWVRKYIKNQEQLDELLKRTGAAGLLRFPLPENEEDLPLLLDRIDELVEDGDYLIHR